MLTLIQAMLKHEDNIVIKEIQRRLGKSIKKKLFFKLANVFNENCLVHTNRKTYLIPEPIACL